MYKQSTSSLPNRQQLQISVIIERQQLQMLVIETFLYLIMCFMNLYVNECKLLQSCA